MKGISVHVVKRSLLLFFTCLPVALIGLPNAGTGIGRAETLEAREAEPAAISCPGTPAQCFTDVPPSNPFFDYANRLYQQGIVTGYPCGGTGEPCDAEHRPYYRPVNNVTRQQMAKFVDQARRQPGIYISATVPISDSPPIFVNITGNHAIWGQTDHGTGVTGISDNWKGLAGFSTSNDGVYAKSGTGNGLTGVSDSGRGVYGTSDGTGVEGVSLATDGVHGTGPGFGVVGVSTGNNLLAGVFGSGTDAIGVYGTSTTNYAGYFAGPVNITGPCTGCFGPSKVDDPLDPANKYLYQSPVQSDDMMDIYNGNVTTDANGEAIVALPDYFEALNKDYRYQLTVIGQFAQAIVSQPVKDNHFTIKTDKPNVQVSWQVTGIRQDPYANAHRVPAEQDKPANEKGKYLHPAELGQPASLAVGYEQPQKMTQPASGAPARP